MHRVFKEYGKVENLELCKTNDKIYLKGLFGVFDDNVQNTVFLINTLKHTIINDGGGILGELEHPKDTTIHLSNVSHKIVSIDVNPNNEVFGTIEILLTEKGRLVNAILDAKLPLYIAPRAIGKIDENTKELIIEKIITFDVVGSSTDYL
jgi:hypothetical protein